MRMEKQGREGENPRKSVLMNRPPLWAPGLKPTRYPLSRQMEHTPGFSNCGAGGWCICPASTLVTEVCPWESGISVTSLHRLHKLLWYGRKLLDRARGGEKQAETGVLWAECPLGRTQPHSWRGLPEKLSNSVTTLMAVSKVYM